jgi:hypothetical protein
VAKSLIAELSGLRWKRSSKHRISALGLLLCRLVLDDIPVLYQYPILDAEDVRCNPVHRLAEAGKSPVHNYEVFLGQDRAWFIPERRRHALD